MEWVLFIKRKEEFSWLDGDSPDIRAAADLAEITFSRIYFGQESCEALIPSSEELEECLFKSFERGLSFTFVTPRVTDLSLDRLRDGFHILMRSPRRTEVVVNDWGVLHLLRNNYDRLEPVLGRVLNRTEGVYDKSNATVLNYFPYRRFLWSNGIRRIEFDCPYQLSGIKLEKTGLSGSLYVPNDSCVNNSSHRIQDLSVRSRGGDRRCTECLGERRELVPVCLPVYNGTDNGHESITVPCSDSRIASVAASIEHRLEHVTSTINRIIYQPITSL